MSVVSRSTQALSGFDPRSIPGCALWLDAGDPSAMILNGSSITSWNNKVPGSIGNFTQSTLSNCPVLSNVNGRSVVRFNSTSTTCTFLSNVTPFNYSTSALYIIFEETDKASVDNAGVYSILPTNTGGSDWNGSNAVSITTSTDFQCLEMAE